MFKRERKNIFGAKNVIWITLFFLWFWYRFHWRFSASCLESDHLLHATANFEERWEAIIPLTFFFWWTIKWSRDMWEDKMLWKWNMLREYKEIAWILERRVIKNWTEFIFKRQFYVEYSSQKDKVRIEYCLL